MILPVPLQGGNLNGYAIDVHNNVWASSRKGLLYILPEGKKKWKPFKKQLGLQEYSLRYLQLHRGPEDKMWLMADSLLIVVNQGLKVDQKMQISSRNLHLAFLGEHIITTSNSLNSVRTITVYNRQQKTQIKLIDKAQIPVKGKQDFRYSNDHKGNLWILTNSGALAFNGQLQKINDGHIFLEGEFISQVVQDREGNYWFSTIGNGLFMMPNRDAIHYNRDNSLLTTSNIYCFAPDDQGNIFIGGNSNQVYFFDSKKQQLSTRYQLPESDIECMFLDNQQQALYIENSHLRFYDVKTDQYLGGFWAGSTPKDICLYQDKYLVVAAGHGGTLLPRADDSLSYPLPQVYHKNFKKVGMRINLRGQRSRTAHAETSGKRFWIGYISGLFYYEKGNEFELKTPEGASIIAVDIQEDTQGRLWVGTLRQGVFAIKDLKIVQHLNTQTGLVSNTCRVVVQQAGELYLGTDKGLQIYDLQSQTSRVFNQEDGLPSNEIKALHLYQDKIYLGTPAGFTVLNKAFSTINDHPPLIYITGLKIKEVAQPLAPRYRLAYNQNNLTINFTGIAMRSAGRFRYKYRMRGLDSSWTYNSSASNFARYASLPSGQYTFEVKAVNEDGVESEQVAQVKLNIAYPIWEKWWFILLSSLLIIGIFLLILFNRVRSVRRKNKLENALGKATLDTLKLQMNPHFIFNAMSAVQHYMTTNDSKMAGNYLARFAQLMRSVLENSRSEYIDLAEEITMLEGYLTLQRLRFQDSFAFTIKVDEQLDPDEIAVPPMFAQPFIENAIEHGVSQIKSGGRIEISFALENEMVLLQIKDNGVGLEKARQNKQNTYKKHKSMATDITRQRIALYQKSLKKNIRFEIDSQEGGTIVRFWLPFEQL